jgi:hypothetical protein
MASTRNKNTPGNYAAEQWSLNSQFADITYIHSPNGQPITTHFPGNGLLTGRMAARDLAKNDVDIESRLFGIGSTNLVNPQGPMTAQVKSLQSLNVIDKIPMIVPSVLYVEPNQRHFQPVPWTPIPMQNREMLR